MGVGLSSTARWFTQALITAPRRAALAIIGADQSIDQACLFKTQRHVVMDDDSTALSATLLRKLFYGWICSQEGAPVGVGRQRTERFLGRHRQADRIFMMVPQGKNFAWLVSMERGPGKPMNGLPETLKQFQAHRLIGGISLERNVSSIQTQILSVPTIDSKEKGWPL